MLGRIQQRGATMMNRLSLPLGTLLLLAQPIATQAMEVAGKSLEVYGTAHISIDYSDPDATGEDSQLSVSNNSTYIGFKGQHAINPHTTLKWQYEQEADIAEGGGEFAKRNSFLGIQGDLGELRVGHHDTPSKKLGSRWGMFSDTVGDRRAILGAYSGYGNRLNDRGENAILYLNQFNSLELQIMYSASNPSESTSGNLDNNDFDLGSISLTYLSDRLTMGGSAEEWSLDPVNDAESIFNVRLAASYEINRLTLGAIYETTDSSDNVFDRDAVGLNAAYQITDTADVRLQGMIADDNADQDNTGASQLALGLFKKLDKATQIYAVFSMTDNESNAVYQGIDGGHGDEMQTTAGGSPSSLSIGGVYKF
jgi:predicted porin